MRKLYLGAILFCAIILMGSGIINLDMLHNYANQEVPSYITLDNTTDNHITDEVATLGRVLFYDTELSLDNQTSCASCHQQEVAFGDKNQVSIGSFGLTGRHSMRLVNSRFSAESRFFWDERASSLEDQSSMPIQDHIEMGYSGQFGQPGIDALIEKMESIDYYNTLFEFAFGDNFISEERIQLALAQFIRSIQSFDSRYDEGRAAVPNGNRPFSNFTNQENRGKQLFLEAIEFGTEGNRIGGGIACAQCHTPPEFSINPNSRTNGVILDATGYGFDEGIIRSPSLRDVFNPAGELNGPLMHNGLFSDMHQVLAHYNDIAEATGNPNTFVDNRLKDGQFIQKLNMTDDEVNSVVAFLKTLTGSDLYTNEKWSNPFDANGELEILFGPTDIQDLEQANIRISPNPVADQINIDNLDKLSQINILDIRGQLMISHNIDNQSEAHFDVSRLKAGVYIIMAKSDTSNEIVTQKFIKL